MSARKPKEPTSLQRARKAHADRMREKGYKAATIWKSPEGQAALDKLSAASPEASTSDLVNAALISAAAKLESGLVPIQRLDVDAEHRLAGPVEPVRSSAEPSAAKVDGATPQKPQPKASDKPAPLGRLKGHWKAP